MKQISRTAYFRLSNIAPIRHVLSLDAAEKLIYALLPPGWITVTLFYQDLRQTSAARVLTNTKKHEDILPMLASLHWLPWPCLDPAASAQCSPYPRLPSITLLCLSPSLPSQISLLGPRSRWPSALSPVLRKVSACLGGVFSRRHCHQWLLLR